MSWLEGAIRNLLRRKKDPMATYHKKIFLGQKKHKSLRSKDTAKLFCMLGAKPSVPLYGVVDCE